MAEVQDEEGCFPIACRHGGMKEHLVWRGNALGVLGVLR